MNVVDVDINKIHQFFTEWSHNKPQAFQDQIEEWIELILSGKQIESANTLQINMFTLKQRDFFINKILPYFWKCKNVDCFVQEHQRQEFDYRVTILNKTESIPAISVPGTFTVIE